MYYVGFLWAVPDNLPQQASAHANFDAVRERLDELVTQDNPYARQLSRLLSAAGQAYLQTLEKVLAKLVNQDMTVALLLGMVLAFTLPRKLDKQMLSATGWVGKALRNAAVIILVTGAGGAFGKVVGVIVNRDPRRLQLISQLQVLSNFPVSAVWLIVERLRDDSQDPGAYVVRKIPAQRAKTFYDTPT